MSKIRFKYTKTGSAKYISHLDLMASLQRSFLRAGINLKYSEGFNPHPYISCALPLSVGVESICELIDVAVADNKIPDIRTIKLPDGIIVNEIYTSNRKFNDITWIEIIVKMHYDKSVSDDIFKRLQNTFDKDEIIIQKRTKRGYKELDIAPFIKDAQFNLGENIYFKAKINAQNPTINADDIENAFDEKIKPDCFSIKRIELYDSNMIEFK